VYSIKKSKTNQKKKNKAIELFARKILNHVDLPNQILFKIFGYLVFLPRLANILVA